MAAALLHLLLHQLNHLKRQKRLRQPKCTKDLQMFMIDPTDLPGTLKRSGVASVSMVTDPEKSTEFL